MSLSLALALAALFALVIADILIYGDDITTPYWSRRRNDTDS